MIRRHVLRVLLGAMAGLPGVSRAQPAPFPQRPVRITTPFPAGSGPDAALRLVAEQLARQWKQPVLVENKPGGNGFLAIASFLQGATDGHDLIQLDSNHLTTHPHTFRKLPYDPARDFAPLRMLLRSHFFVAVGRNSRFRSVEDLLREARAQPGRVSYGSWFNGSPGHMGALRLQTLRDLQMLHVPYRDFGQLYAAVASGEVDWALGSVASAGALEKAGRLRFLAYAAPAREPSYPEVPTSSEIPGLQGYEVSGWTGLFAPAAVPVPVMERIAGDIGQALARPEVIERYKALGYERPELDWRAFAALIERETQEWGDVVRRTNLRLD
ncbi:Bug family tripartite tricarboxylate transporter substrate binding protein [Azohydromonas aeria]|uniref:Bug family tripartite tricarboxylate transporter substrate binding protein n=1 Tax=Azohydromonas aeria TaxID=2590212 RepID=UPI0012FA9264|nr:tripartite tricarboxylate transporter substrate binding protein [Azohydromonas aeria]